MGFQLEKLGEAGVPTIQASRLMNLTDDKEKWELVTRRHISRKRKNDQTNE
jgi:hypothetical protein